MPVPEPYEFFIDPGRCIGCNACVQACTECDTHKGRSMIQLDFVDLARSPQTAPLVCMHCESPTCAEVCPADAIKRTDDGVVQSARKPRCIACNNCVLACPFGIPKMDTAAGLMMKCDLCYDRTSEGLKPMCASVCPSGALWYGTREEITRMRRRSKPVSTFQFGRQTIRTKVNVMVPTGAGDVVDVVAGLRQPAVGHEVAEGVWGHQRDDILDAMAESDVDDPRGAGAEDVR
jgi:Fe-S-cluster-containing dehydrogenase component